MEMAGYLAMASRLVGYSGAAVLVVAYFLNQRGALPSEDWRFPALNLLGSSALMISLIWEPNLPSVVIELFWAAISLYGVRKSLLRRKRHS
jgi:hypothetical protein